MSAPVGRWAKAHPLLANTAAILIAAIAGGVVNMAIGVRSGEAFNWGLFGGGVALVAYFVLMAWIGRSMRKVGAFDPGPAGEKP